MKTKCPCCGAVNSLDSLVANEKASEALSLALAVSGELGKGLIGYLGLFRPEKTALSFDRVASLLAELLPFIQRAEIERDGKCYPAPVEAWIYAINQTLANRHSLKLPLKSHGYLLEIMSHWKGQAHQNLTIVNKPSSATSHQSKTLGALQRLHQMKGK